MLERLLGSFPDVIQLLRDDHKLVRSLFAQYAKASNGEKPQIAHQIIRELTVHAAIEERVVYPAFRAAFRDVVFLRSVILISLYLQAEAQPADVVPQP